MEALGTMAVRYVESPTTLRGRQADDMLRTQRGATSEGMQSFARLAAPSQTSHTVPGDVRQHGGGKGYVSGCRFHRPVWSLTCECMMQGHRSVHRHSTRAPRLGLELEAGTGLVRRA